MSEWGIRQKEVDASVTMGTARKRGFGLELGLSVGSSWAKSSGSIGVETPAGAVQSKPGPPFGKKPLKLLKKRSLLVACE